MEVEIGQSLDNTLGQGQASLVMSGNENGFLAADIASSFNISMPSPNAGLQCQFNCAGVGYEAPQATPAEPSIQPEYKPDGFGLG